VPFSDENDAHANPEAPSMITPSRSVALAAGAALLVGVLGAGIAIGSGALSGQGQPTAGPATAAAIAQPAPGTNPTADAVDAALAAFDQAGASDAAGLAAPDATARPTGQRIRQFARWKQLVHATVTVDRPGSGIRTFELDHGTITALPAGSITISEAGGAGATLATDASTRVRKDRAKSALSDLSSGDQVIVVSMVGTAGSPPRALLVVVPPAAPKSPTQ
jgi:hypothetical protein